MAGTGAGCERGAAVQRGVISEEVRSLTVLPESGRGWKLGRPVETNVSLSGVSLGAAHRVPATTART